MSEHETRIRATPGTILPETIAAREAAAYAEGLPPATSSATLLAVLQRRLEEQNQTFGVYMRGITANTDRADAVLGIMQELLVLKAEGESFDNADLGVHQHLAIIASETARLGHAPTTADLDLAFANYITDLSARAASVGIDLSLDVREGAGGSWMVAGPILTGIESAKQKLQEINSGSEIEMVRLQDVMQSRSSDVQLFTNLLKQLNDGHMAIIRNMG